MEYFALGFFGISGVLLVHSFWANIKDKVKKWMN